MKKKILISTLILTITLSNITTFSKPVKAYEIIKYHNGYVYIKTPNEKVAINENDILIIDERKEKNNIKIVNSYKIKSLKSKLEIIDMILKYNKDNPSESYSRSKNSLFLEWMVHDFLYYLAVEKDRTKSVDFENNEENIYNIKSYIKKFFIKKQKKI